jgi:hypothetical protein
VELMRRVVAGAVIRKARFSQDRVRFSVREELCAGEPDRARKPAPAQSPPTAPRSALQRLSPASPPQPTATAVQACEVLDVAEVADYRRLKCVGSQRGG